MSDLRIFENKAFKDPGRFITQPTIGLSIQEGEAFAHVTTVLTPHTAAELRGLADQAERVWAEYAAYEAAREVSA